MSEPSRAPVADAPLLSIVIPVYNEAENIVPTLSALGSLGLPPHEILVVYDQDEDTTLPVLKARAREFPLARPVKNRRGRGALNAIRTGFDEARGEGVVVVMADMADDLRGLLPMIEAFRQGADVVCGSRYMRGGAQRGGPKLKGLLSRTAGLSLHVLTGIPTRDVTNSFKLYRRAFLQTVTIESSGGFEIGMELTVKAFLAGRRVAEVPSVWTDRTAGESRFDMRRWLPRYLGWYLYALRGRFVRKDGR
ncbi:MAG TPA: glycosyltransferase [Myxococcales bacterium]|nr:glycosyltransferase [Myxococcales bacterium]